MKKLVILFTLVIALLYSYVSYAAELDRDNLPFKVYMPIAVSCELHKNHDLDHLRCRDE